MKYLKINNLQVYRGLGLQAPLREATCWTCEYCDRKNAKRDIGYFDSSAPCLKKNKIIELHEGKWCDEWKFIQLGDTIAKDGIAIRSNINKDYRTEKQWKTAHRKIKMNAVGVIMHPNARLKKVFNYYLIEETEFSEDRIIDIY